MTSVNIVQADNQMELAIHRLREQERVIEQFEADQMAYEAHHDEKNKMSYPDLVVKGVSQKKCKARGGENLITLDKLHVRSLFSFIKSRSYFRLAFLRVIWIPTASSLPGQVKIGIKDLRAHEGHQEVDSKSSLANRAFHFSYFQDIYVHRSELSKIAIFVKLEGYEEKYKEDFILGTFRIHWIIQNTNVPTQHRPTESTIQVPKLERMPSVHFVQHGRISSACGSEGISVPDQNENFQNTEETKDLNLNRPLTTTKDIFVPVTSIVTSKDFNQSGDLNTAKCDDCILFPEVNAEFSIPDEVIVHDQLKKSLCLKTKKSDLPSSSKPKELIFQTVSLSEIEEESSWDVDSIL